MEFNKEKKKTGKSSIPVNVSLQNDESENVHVAPKQGSLSIVDQLASEGSTVHQTCLDTVFMTLEKDTIKFVKNELKKIQGLLNRERLQNQDVDEEMLYEEEKKRSKEAVLNISLHFLRIMNHGELADELLNSDFPVSQSEDSDETQLSSNDGLSEEHDNQTRSGRIKMKRSVSLSPGCVPLTSDMSKDFPLGYQRTAPDTPHNLSPSCFSIKSGKSLDYPMTFKQTAPNSPHNPSPSCLSVKSDKSMDYPLTFKRAMLKTRSCPTDGAMSLQSPKCMDYPDGFKHSSYLSNSPHHQVHKRFTDLDSVFKAVRLSNHKRRLCTSGISSGFQPLSPQRVRSELNHPEESGVKLLSAGLKDPNWALQMLKMEPSGSQFLNPGLNKYACELMLDPNTAHRNLKLSDNNRKVTMGG
ncbi:uncharacterized protein FYW61_006642 [Anableps anableps]